MSTVTIAAAGVAACEQAGRGVDLHCAGIALFHEELRYAAGGVAAGFHLAAVGVENAHRGIGAVGAFADHKHQIAADPEAPVGDRFRRRLVERDRSVSRVEYGEIVAQPVHFQECGHRAGI